MQDEKYQQKSKSISSAEPNYFVHFAMRHPVISPEIFYQQAIAMSISNIIAVDMHGLILYISLQIYL